MSCIHCENKTAGTVQVYPCPCDTFIHPLPLSIDTGLSTLPRQIATFHEFRRAMLRALKTERVDIVDATNTPVPITPLAGWRARDNDDLGIMLLEMWAYMCDTLSFYDEVIAHETYLRTSVLRPNVRRLVALLGYQPRPAVGAMVELAAFAEGRLQLTLPTGTAFRSTAFNGNPPQVFELDDDAFIHPLTNKYGIKPPHRNIVPAAHPQALLVNPAAPIKEDTKLLLLHKTDNTQSSAVIVTQLEYHTGSDNRRYTRLSFAAPTRLKAGAHLGDLRLTSPTLTAGLWTISEAAESLKGKIVVLNVSTPQLKAGECIIISYLQESRWFRVTAVQEVMRSSIPANTVTINGHNYTIPGVQQPVTQLTLDVDINAAERKTTTATWTTSIATGITVYFGMQPAATVVDEPNATLIATDPLNISTTVETPVEAYNPVRFLVQDKNTLGAAFGGSLLYPQKKILVNPVNNWAGPLTLPVEVFGNVLTASRGETVKNETLGSGNASAASQTFKLKKKPLTYHTSPTVDNDSGVKSTLTVYVNGIEWTEVSSFFGKTESDQVYIVRQTDDGESLVTFGDGIRGQRLPSGRDNVTGNYRFGAGAAAPPAGAVSQVGKPVKGLQRIKNVLPAYGGADAETAENLRTYAPRSALVLGRVVSMKDMEALAASFPGVRAVQTEWRWDNRKQRASAHIYYIGDPGLQASLSKRVRSYADPATPITVENAQAVPLFLSIDVAIKPRYTEDIVLRELRAMLTAATTGFLVPENIGIGLPLYRSKLFERVLNVEGTESVNAVFLGTQAFKKFAVTPHAGRYFDIEQGSLTLNGNATP